MNRLNAFWAAAPSPGTLSGSEATSQIELPIVFACEITRDSDVDPIPRRGELTARIHPTFLKRVTPCVSSRST